MTKDEIIRALAEMKPEQDSGFGDVYCFFCGELLGYDKTDGNTTEHNSKCIWYVANMLIESGDISL